MVDSTQENTLFSIGTQTVSNREFAEIVGVTEGAIRKAILRGTLTAFIDLPNGRRRLALDVALSEWRASQHDTEPAPDGGTPSEFTREQIMLTRTKRQIAETELAEINGVLFHEQDIRAVLDPLIMATKAALLNLPTELGPLMTGDDAHDTALLEQGIRQALNEISNYDPAEYAQHSRRRRKKTPIRADD